MKANSFPTDLTDGQWTIVQSLIPPPASGGRKRTVNIRNVVNAIRYLLATGSGWRQLPAQFPNRSTVRHYYDAWRENGIWKQIEKAVGAAEKDATSPDCADGEDSPKPGDATS